MTSALGIFLSAISILSVTSCSTLSGEAPGYKVTTIASLTLNSGSSSFPNSKYENIPAMVKTNVAIFYRVFYNFHLLPPKSLTFSPSANLLTPATITLSPLFNPLTTLILSVSLNSPIFIGVLTAIPFLNR